MITDNFPDISFIDNATVDEIMTAMINDYQEKYKELTKKEASLALANPYRLIMWGAPGIFPVQQSGVRSQIRFRWEACRDRKKRKPNYQKMDDPCNAAGLYPELSL